MAILNTCGDVHVEIGPDDGAKDQALPGSLLQTGFGLEYGGIVSSVVRRTSRRVTALVGYAKDAIRIRMKM